MNKKGTTSFASVLSIPEILLVIFVILSVIFLISGALLKNVDSRDAQSRIIALTPLYSNAGISYYDEDLGRILVGTIDLAKFNDETLESSMHMPDNKMVAAKFTLYNTDKSEIKTAYYNKEWYELWEPLSGYPGAGGSQTVITERYVILKNSLKNPEEKAENLKAENFETKALLKIEIITPNS